MFIKRFLFLWALVVFWGQGACAADIFHQGHFWHFTNFFGQDIRAASWTGDPEVDRDTTVVLLQGRASFIEKHEELITDLVKRGYYVKTFDWSGQGGSGRFLKNTYKGHIDSFDQYLSDLDVFMRNHVLPVAAGKIVLLGVSMGGHLALRYVKEHADVPIAGLILLAPMLDVVTDPIPRSLAPSLVSVAVAFGGKDAYAFGRGDFNLKGKTFEKNKETQSPERYKRKIKILKENPYYVLGGPTYGWVKAAFESMDKTRNPSYLHPIKTPILLMTAGKDKILLTQDDHRICAALPKCIHKVYRNAFHNIAIEIDKVRNVFLGDLEDFIRLMVED